MSDTAATSSRLFAEAFAPLNESTVDTLGAVPLGREVRGGTPLHGEIVGFLAKEAFLLDHDAVDEWATLLAEDLRYTAPIRRTVLRRDGLGYDDVVNHFDDDYESMMFRVHRLARPGAWAEDPPSRVRRHVTNVLVFETAVEGEYVVFNSLLVLRNRWNDDSFDLISAGREDLLRRAGDDFEIARRRILVDQARLGTPNLSIFL